MKRVVIIGGGIGGISLAGSLEGKADVTVIERNASYHYNLVSLRAVVDETYRWQQFVPYDERRKFKVVRGEVAGMDDKNVILADGQNVAYDVAVIATGGKHSFPGKIESFSTIDEGIKKYNEVAEAVKAAQDVVILGAGPVGIELSGEIKSHFPNKNVTLIHNHPHVLSSFQPPLLPEMIAGVEQKLADHGIKLLLDERVMMERLPNGWEAGQKELKTEKGTVIKADLVLQCVGFIPNTSFLKAYLGKSILENGQVKVNDFLQVEGKANVFALGDVISTPETKLAYIATGSHAPVVQKNILSVLKGQPPSKKYVPAKAASTLIPIGPDDAIAQIMFLPFGNGVKKSGMFAGMKNKNRLFIANGWKDVRGSKVPAQRIV